jgi:WD40 repeat protein
MPLGDGSRRRSIGAQSPYRWVATLQEDLSTSGPEATWSVQFALPPSPDHRAGGGRCWFAPASESDLVPTNASAAPQKLARTPVAENMAVVVDDDDDDVVEVVEVASSTAQMSSDRSGVGGDCAILETDATAGGQELREMDATGTGGGQLQTEWTHVFATCNDSTVRVYKAVKGSKPIQLQIYQDPNQDEVFFSVSWTFNVNGNCEWWLAAAGKRGVLRILNVSQCRVEHTLIGHGESINDVKTHPRDPALLLTASKDESLRLWNLRTKSTVAVFAGLRGHRGEVLYADFHHTGKRFASCGIDNSIRIWEIDSDEKVLASIKETHDAADRGIKDVCVYEDENGQRRKARVPVVQFPTFSSHRICRHYVDCTMVRTGGDYSSLKRHVRVGICPTSADFCLQSYHFFDWRYSLSVTCVSLIAATELPRRYF